MPQDPGHSDGIYQENPVGDEVALEKQVTQQSCKTEQCVPDFLHPSLLLSLL